MNEAQEKFLKDIVDSGESIYWIPDDRTCKKVYSVTERHSDIEENDEFGLCANFTNGQYAALYGAELSEFATIKRLENN